MNDIIRGGGFHFLSLFREMLAFRGNVGEIVNIMASQNNTLLHNETSTQKITNVSRRFKLHFPPISL